MPSEPTLVCSPRCSPQRATRLAAVFLLAWIAFTPCAGAQLRAARLGASDGAIQDGYGRAVAVDGQTAVVGARAHDHPVNNGGAAYVYRQEGTSWVEQQELFASDAGFQDVFGWCLDIDDDVIVSGAWKNGDNGTWSGSAYVFRRDGASWQEQALLLAADGAVQDEFGRDVAVSGDVVVAGAHFDDDLGSDSGSAHVYRWDGLAWSHEQKLLAGDGGAGDNFGEFVDVDGDLLVVGAPGQTEEGIDAGAAYVFRWNGASWVQEAKLLAGDGAGGELFGMAGAICGDVIVVGAPWDDDLGDATGSAYVFRWNGAAWTPEQKLLASDGDLSWFGPRFGLGAAVDGGTILIAAPQDDGSATLGGGAFYEFRWDGASWSEVHKIIDDGTPGYDFDEAVALSGDVAVLGSTDTSFILGRADVVLLNWSDLDLALDGTSGTPRLTGAGALLGNDTVWLSARDTRPNANAWIIGGFARLDTPFKGGTMVPDTAPPALILPLVTSANGTLDVDGTWPAGVPAGFTIYYQVWVEDPAGPAGFAATNAISAIAP